MIDVIMPRLSDTMEEGTIVAWHKRPGEQVERGDVLAEIQTDKATVELEAFDEGILDRIEITEGLNVAIGTVIARLRGQDESVGSANPGAVEAIAPVSSAKGVQAPLRDAPHLADPTGLEATPTNVSRVKASPLAKKVARERGVDLQVVAGSGAGGRIVRADVDRAATATDARVMPRHGRWNEAEPNYPLVPSVPATDKRSTIDLDDDIEVLSPIRSIVARRMSESVRDAPHFYATVTFAAEGILALRANLRTMATIREGFTAPSVNDLIVVAVSRALVRHRDINASFAENRIVHRRGVHVGIAVALDGGLIVPVLRDTDRKSVSAIAAESRDLSLRARDGKLRPEEFRGSTFTVSNLGMFGIEQFTAIINQPEAAILAVGAVRDEPVVRDGAVVPGKVCSLTLSSDHRVIDGAAAARFLAELKSLLEEPLGMLV
jgi:pyruvate dehydrogenase E2 component (dihydrolipoamide acetyltransferase)